MPRRVTVAFLVLMAGPLAALAAGDAGVEFFEKKIRPVLAEHCLGCHSSDPKKQKGGLALDSRAGVHRGGESGRAIVPGKPNESLLIKAVRYTDPEFTMPPKGKLPAAVIADLEKWVAMGAPDSRFGTVLAEAKWGNIEQGRKFWAYQPPRQHALPEVKTAGWARGPIDRFLLAKLESRGLRPSGDADGITLIRRATFALTGLPPTPAEIDAFLADRAPEAFAKVVDRLLASPHFGERWGRHWLDVARYAESSGGGRSLLFTEAWRYRDYVVRAFNSDLPYNRFILEQIAGDLLPSATPEERRDLLIATAFLLLGPHNYELQDKPTLEMDIADEQVDTMGKAFLGMTIGCARCHDHKFDPIPTKDYYALVGIMKSTKVIVHDNVSRWVEQPLPLPPAQELLVRQHEKAVTALKQQLALAKAAEKKAGKDVEVLVKGPLAPADLPGIVIDDTQANTVGSWKQSTFSGNYVGKGYLYDDRGMKGEKTVTFIPDFAKTGVYEVRVAYVPYENRASNVPVRIFHTDGDVTVRVNQRLTPPIEGRWVSLGRYRFEQGMQWFVMVSTDGANGHVVADAVQFLPEDAAAEGKPATAAASPGKGSAAPRDSKALEAELKRLLADAPYRPTAMAVADATQIEDCHIRIRGNTHNKGELAPRGVLQILTPPHAKAPVIPANESGRRQLADWLASPDNPLTARVMVNRIWHHLFGAGLVRTVDNFGATGETPSHPELLDYLALRFIEDGWSVKKLIGEIMLSHVYQQSSELGVRNSESTPRSKLRTPNSVDPENRLLWRMNRRRLDAEALRDSMLMVSGRLDRAVGGATMKKGTTVERDYRFDDTRRSVYTPIFRNKLLELFEVFDFADPNISMGRRNVSTVATQALYFMNSPFAMDQARAAATALLAEPGLDDKSRVERAYRLALGRMPTERERQLALSFVAAAGGERVAAWERFCQTLFACIDFRYVE